MKELKAQASYIDDFDVNVRHYFTLGEIDEIAMEVAKLGTFLEREQMICYKVLCHCTDIGDNQYYIYMVDSQRRFWTG